MTQFLAQVFGIYLAIMCIALVLRHGAIKAAGWQMVSQPPILLFSAIFTLMLGLALVLTHNVWVMDWPVLVTIICWMVFIKGLFLLFFPQKAELTMMVMMHKGAMCALWLIDAIYAGLLLYIGFCL